MIVQTFITNSGKETCNSVEIYIKAKVSTIKDVASYRPNNFHPRRGVFSQLFSKHVCVWLLNWANPAPIQ